MEASEAGASEKAEVLIREFSIYFRLMKVTLHPSNISNEMRGKSSNVAWAARQISLTIPASTDSSNTLMTIIDADTCFASDYFEGVSSKYVSTLAHKRRLQLFTPLNIFDRNSSSVPVFVRIFDISWSSAQLAYMMPNYPFSPALSAYTLPFDLAREIGFWDRHWGAMAEDMHMTFKIIIATKGRVEYQQMYSPASQCNIVGNNSGIWSSAKARTIQLKRHNWGGALEFSGVLALKLVKLFGGDTETPTLTDDFMYGGKKRGVVEKAKDWFHGLLVLMFSTYHLLEITVLSGHCMMVNVMTAVFVPEFGPALLNPIAFWWWDSIDTKGLGVPAVVSALKLWVPYVQMCVLICMAFVAIGYEGTFYWCSSGRWKLNKERTESSDSEALGISLLGKRSALFSQERKWYHLFEWILFPLVAVYFAIVMLYVSLLQIMRGRLEYVVAAKPTVDVARVTSI
ncbi:UNVERIFIED_CONTAM: hypothetical protein HDU68_010183 [Siphonaria sp. JEL0065]|nr:hypothetical protein HDU68_010183 [Siphonaria sp. JEL0065]